jgi:hypothetical protein
MAMVNNRLSRDLLPPNNARGQGSLSVNAMQYVSDIKSSSSELSNVLRDLSGPAFKQQTTTVDNTGEPRSKDMSHVRGVVESLVRSYNNLFSAAAENVNDFKAQSLASRLMNVTAAYSRSLSEIGIGFDNSGKMTIDTPRLNQAFESGRLEQFFTENSGNNFGFTATLGRLADNVSNNPANFVSSPMFDSPMSGNFAYSGFGQPIQSNFPGSGSLFDYMF